VAAGLLYSNRSAAQNSLPATKMPPKIIDGSAIESLKGNLAISGSALSVQLVAKPVCFEHTTTSAVPVAIVNPEKPYLVQSETFASIGKL
jgi:hypothetical protein